VPNHTVIVFVRPDEFDQDAAIEVSDVRHDAVFVTTDVEDHPAIRHEVRTVEHSAHICGALPFGARDQAVPSPKRQFGARVSGPEVSQGPKGDNLHRSFFTLFHILEQASPSFFSNYLLRRPRA
jgi:hypothetical protein